MIFVVIICEFGEKLRYEIENLGTPNILPDMAVSTLKVSRIDRKMEKLSERAR